MGNCAVQGRNLLIVAKRLFRSQSQVSPLQRIKAEISVRVRPLPVSRHGPPFAAPLIQNKILGHPEQIGAAIGNGAGVQLGQLEPQLLHKVVDLNLVTAAGPDEADKVGPMYHEYRFETVVRLNRIFSLPSRGRVRLHEPELPVQG